MTIKTTLLMVVFGATLAGAATLKLPDPIALPKGPDSPGKVVFNHESHVDADRPSCTSCHPKEFRILKATRRTTVTHERMDEGRQCGACHDGKRAFARDDCTFCHQS